MGARAEGPYSHQPIRFFVPYAACGLPDTVARIVAQKLTERLGQPVAPEVAKQYAPLGIEQVTAGPAEFGRELSAEIDRVSKVVAAPTGRRPHSESSSSSSSKWRVAA